MMTKFAYEDGTDSVPKRRLIKYRRRGITQKKTYKILSPSKTAHTDSVAHPASYSMGAGVTSHG
jgi:hypothetical protein